MAIGQDEVETIIQENTDTVVVSAPSTDTVSTDSTQTVAVDSPFVETVVVSEGGQGPRGVQGVQGLQGDTVVGPEGPQGQQGPKGLDGAAVAGTFVKTNIDTLAVVEGVPVFIPLPYGFRRAAADSMDNCTVIGLLRETASVGQPGTIQADGIFATSPIMWASVTDSAGLTEGAKYYLSPIAGKLTKVAPDSPGEVVVVVGRAISATELVIKIEQPIYL